MLAFSLCIFTGAFLLFLVQPLMAKFILPWFGGSPAVWTTCMLFFQVTLLGGYVYAHVSVRRLSARGQVGLHLGLLVAALLLLPITPGENWKPADSSAPAAHILLLLAACLGLPYLVLSATGPLMQAWFTQARPGASPYRLYSVSNLGSLLALASYPFLVEPHLSRRAQAGAWSIGLAGFALLAAWCGVMVWRRRDGVTPGVGAWPEAGAGQGSISEPAPAEERRQAPWLWMALPACASALLLAVTNELCQDIAVIPFLWVLPLSLYLVSFIVSFDSPRWYWRPVWLPALVLALAGVIWMTLGPTMGAPHLALLKPVHWLAAQAHSISLFKSMGLYLGTLFICCMVCHGELYRMRPRVEGLTAYYLMIATGGALGGLFVAVLAPLLFRGRFELQVSLFASALLAAAVVFLDRDGPLHRGRPVWAWMLAGLGLAGLGAGFYEDAAQNVRGAVEMSRNFYGVLKVKEAGAEHPETHFFSLAHGGTTHGLQYVSPERRRRATTYYGARSGVGRLMKHFPRTENRRVGVIGLGTGTLAAWGRPGDYFRFYEINQAVERLARQRFSYLSDSAATVDIVLGDARLNLEREPAQRFDILVLDAFSGDSIPVHLLTREAFEIYRRHLKPDGVIAAHVSNHYLELEPVVLQVAAHFNLQPALLRNNKESWYDDEEDEDEDGGWPGENYSSEWILLTSNEAVLQHPGIAGATTAFKPYSPKIKLWTDEQSDLFRILVLDEDGWLSWLRRRVG